MRRQSCGLLSLAKQWIGERVKAHARKTSARGQVEIAAAMLSGKRIHIDAAVQKPLLNPRMLDDVLEAVGAAATLVRENVDA